MSSTVSIPQRIFDIWDKLVKPHPSLEDLETQKNARLLSELLITIPLTLVFIVLIVGSLDRKDLLVPSTIGAYFMIVLCFILYFINQAGYYHRAKYTFIMATCITMVILPYLPDSTASVAPFGVISVILVGIFYSGIWMYLTAVIVLVVTFILNRLSFGDEHFWELQTDWYFLIFASGLVIVFIRHMQELEQLRHQKLELANQQLRESEEMLEQRVKDRTTELQVAYEKVEALNRVKDEFVSNVSHELRTPITSIKLQNYLVNQSASPKQKIYLETLQRETDRLETLIESLLTLSRLDQERIDLHFERINLNHIIEEYTIDRKSIAESKQLRLESVPHTEAVWVSGDKNLLGQVLSILLTNAVNYTPQGGQIIIRSTEINQHQKKWARMSVEDTGMGIPPDEQEQLFSRFFRGHSARQTKVSGTGLGLAIAKKIVDQHQGLITVESTGIPEQGTTFHIQLPSASH